MLRKNKFTIIFILFNVFILFLFRLNNVNPYINQNNMNSNFVNMEIKQTSLGLQHSAAIIKDGNESSTDLYTWGNNDSGQLGLGNNDSFNTPQKVTSLPEGAIEQISLGSFHSGAVINDGTSDSLYTWGNNDSGQLGLGDNVSYNEPKKVINLHDGEIEQISFGGFHSSAIVNDGTSNHLYVWGSNSKGQLGLGNKSDYSVPTEATTLPHGEIEKISLGNNHSVALTSDNEFDYLYTWGYGYNGQLGLGDNEDSIIPEQIAKLPKGQIKDISASNNHNFVVVNSGGSDVLYTWGKNNSGQLGLGDEEDRNTAQKVTGLPDGEIEQISSGHGLHTMVLINDGTSDHLFSWGENFHGQLGLGDEKINGNVNIPTEVTQLPPGKIEQISSGITFSSIILKNDGKDYLYLCGQNDNGQLGLGDNNDYNIFTYLKYFKDSEISTLTEASTLSTSTNDAKISVSANSDESLTNDDVSVLPYSLEVVDSEGLVVGTSDSGTLTTSGTKTFNITNLDANHDYGKVKVRVVENKTIVSNEFDLKTKLNTIEKLEDAGLDGPVGYNSAKIKVTSSFEGSTNTDVNNYSLEVINDSDVVVGISDSGTLATDGEQTFYINGLEASHDYGDVRVRVVEDKTIVSNKFALLTTEKKQSVSSLTDAGTQGDPIGTSVKIYVVVSSEDLINSDIINPYSLEVVDKNDAVIGTSSASNLNTNGPQTFDLTNLEPNTTYDKAKVRVVDNHDVISNEFTIITEDREAIQLSDASASSITYDSAIISVNVLTTLSMNDNVKDYALIISDDKGMVWEQDGYNTDGIQEFELNDLNWNHTYNDLSISIKGLDQSKINIDSFTTKDDPVSLDPNSFNIDKNSIDKNSFNFSIDITFKDGYSKEDFDPSDLHLLSNGKELNTSFIEKKDNDESSNFIYKVSNLKQNKNYSNFVIHLKKGSVDTSIKNISVKTLGSNIIMITEITVPIFFLLFILLVIMFVIFKKKKEKEEVYPVVKNDGYNHGTSYFDASVSSSLKVDKIPQSNLYPKDERKSKKDKPKKNKKSSPDEQNFYFGASSSYVKTNEKEKTTEFDFISEPDKKKKKSKKDSYNLKDKKTKNKIKPVKDSSSEDGPSWRNSLKW